MSCPNFSFKHRAAQSLKLKAFKITGHFYAYILKALVKFIYNCKKYFKGYFEKNHLFKLSTSQARYLKSIPIKLNPFSEELTFVSETTENLQILKYKSIFHSTLVGVQLLQCLLSTTKILNCNQSIFDQIFGWLAFQVLLTTSIILHITRVHGPIFRHYLNNIFDISKRITNNTHHNFTQSITSKLKFNLLAVPILLISGNLFGPILVFGFHWKNQCKSSLVGYFLLEECLRETIDENINILKFARVNFAKWITFIVNIYMWNLGGSCGAFMITLCYIISPIIQQEFIQFIKIHLQLNNQSVYESLSLYRPLQILNTLYNETQRNALGILMVCGTLGASICLAFLVSSLSGVQENANALVFATYGMSFSNFTITLVLVLGGMVAISIKSKEYLKQVSKLEVRQRCRHERLWIRKYWRSCANIKIQFGENNFLENLTPLRCLDWAVNMAVQVLLVRS